MTDVTGERMPQQQRPEMPTVIVPLMWQARKYRVHKLHQNNLKVFDWTCLTPSCSQRGAGGTKVPGGVGGGRLYLTLRQCPLLALSVRGP